MRGSRALWAAATLLSVLVAPVMAQVVSEKQDIAVFALSTYDTSVPASVLGSVDAAIQQVFISLGRFNVMGMTYRLSRGDVDLFIAKIRELKEQNVEIPEQVQMGREFFTEADLNRIIGSFIVVIPSVTSFTVEGSSTSTTTRTSTTTSSTPPADKSGTVVTTSTRTVQQDTTGLYHARLEASFTFISVSDMTAFAQATVQTDGYDDDRDVAARESVDDLPVVLTYEVRKIEEFKLKTGVLEVQGRTVIMELGRDLGVMVGDEYEIVGSRVLASGRVLDTRTGLLVVREVGEEVSIAQVIYATRQPEVGDQLKEFPLFGASVLPYAHLLLGSVVGSEVVLLPGLRAVWNRGLYRFKPQVGVELPIALGGGSIASGGLAVNLYAGGEMDLYLGRLQLNPTVAVGLGGSVPLGDSTEFYLSHIGFKAAMNATFLVGDKLKLSADGGFAYWADVRGLDNDYYGPFVGAGVEIKL